MIKCPNCGSTAQVKVKEQNWGEKVAIRLYECGCGCMFTRIYDLNEMQSPCIIRKGMPLC